MTFFVSDRVDVGTFGRSFHLERVVMVRVLVLVLPLGVAASLRSLTTGAGRRVAHDLAAHVLAISQDSLMLMLMDEVVRALGQTLTSLVVLLLYVAV